MTMIESFPSGFWLCSFIHDTIYFGNILLTYVIVKWKSISRSILEPAHLVAQQIKTPTWWTRAHHATDAHTKRITQPMTEVNLLNYKRGWWGGGWWRWWWWWWWWWWWRWWRWRWWWWWGPGSEESALDNIWVMLSSRYGTWWVKQTPEAKPCTIHDKSSLPWRVKVLHDTAGMQPVSFSSCHSLSPNERFAATSRVGPTYWDVRANAARSRRGKLWANVTGHPCKNTRGGQRHEIRSS